MAVGRPTPFGVKVLMYILSVFSVLIVLLAISTKKLLSASLCKDCHVMQTQYISQIRSLHDKAGCLDCHAGKGCVSCHDPGRIDSGMAGSHINTDSVVLHDRHVTKSMISCKVCHQHIMHANIYGTHGKIARGICLQCHSQIVVGNFPQ